MNRVHRKIITKMMVGFAPFGAKYVDYMVKIVGSCIFLIKICAGLAFFHRKICNIYIKSKGGYAEKCPKSDYR